MSEPGPTLDDVLLRYEAAALPELGAVATLDAIRLLEAVDRRLASGMLGANRPDLEAAIRMVVTAEGGGVAEPWLRTEVVRLLDEAVAAGLVNRHPWRRGRGGGGAPGVGSTVEPALPDREEIAAILVRVVGNVLEEAVGSSLLLSPMATPLAEIGEEGGALDRTAESLGSRWRTTTHRLRRPLDFLRVVVPAVALVLAVNSFFSCRGPLGSRTEAALHTGAAVQQLKKLTARMPPDIGDPGTIHTLRELAERTGLPTDAAEGVFRLRRVRHGTVYLEHADSGALVVVSGVWVGSLRDGTWRMSE